MSDEKRKEEGLKLNEEDGPFLMTSFFLMDGGFLSPSLSLPLYLSLVDNGGEESWRRENEEWRREGCDGRVKRKDKNSSE